MQMGVDCQQKLPWWAKNADHQRTINQIWVKYRDRIKEHIETEDWMWHSRAEYAMQWGPAHLVWEDHNYDKAQWCLDHWHEYDGDIPKAQLDIVRESLIELIGFLRGDPWEPSGFPG